MSTPTVRVFDRADGCHEVPEHQRHYSSDLVTGCGIPATKRASRDGSPSEVTCPDCLLFRRIRLEHAGEEVDS